MILFRIFWAIDAIAALIIIWFFLEGIGDSTLSGKNIGIWMILLVISVGTLVGSIWLRNHDYRTIAILVLLIPALPALLYLLFILFALFGNQRWN